MILPHARIEKRLKKDGVDFVIGVDEAGRGPLAGPVVASAVWISPGIYNRKFDKRKLIRDSKMLSPKQRGEIHEFIAQSDDFFVGIGEVSEKMIDQMNILNATFLAMRIAVENLMTNYKLKMSNKIPNRNACLLVDGNRKIPRIKHDQKVFPKGDRDIFSIAVASICAKVHRDEIMIGYHQRYPQYGFDTHKGYGTRKHMKRLEKHGPCKIHRKSFGPVANFP